MEKEVTFYRFYSNICSFLTSLLRDPISAEPSKFLKEYGLYKKRLIHILLKRDVIIRHESIKDITNSEEVEAKYCVLFKVKRKDFEKKIKKIYINFFERNLPKKENKKLNECDCGSVGGCDAPAGATTCDASAGQFLQPLTKTIINRPAYGSSRLAKGKGKNIDPTKILGKTISEGKHKVIFSEEQFNLIQEIINTVNNADEDIIDEETTTFNTGNYAYDAPGLVIDKNDECFDTTPGTVAMGKERVGEKKKK